MKESLAVSCQQKISCLDGQIYLVVPSDWTRASDEITARKFPYSIKPQEIYTNPEADRIFTLSMLDRQLQENQVYSAIREMQRLISHIYPESIRKSARGLRTCAGVAGWFSFGTGGLEGDILHYMFILPLNDQMMFGSFHFPEETIEEDDEVFFNALKNIRTLHDMEDGPENYE